MSAKQISVDTFRDPRGSLMVGEYPKSLPFDPVRFFVVSDVPEGVSRGNHAHKSNQQVLFCLSGYLTVNVYDGSTWEEFKLTPGPIALYLPALHWGEQKDFGPGTHLLVIASEPYSAEEYIHSLDEFVSSL
jgi:dTDP-4-dehydrorhamnose 3,5-epimerase-like enzyme